MVDSTSSQSTLTQKEMLKTLLKENVLSVVFIKKDGSERVMECTLKPDLLPVQDENTESKDKVRTENQEVIQVYDLENEGWRSFRVDSVMAFMIRENNGN